MPSPFNQDSQAQLPPGVQEITDSELYCQFCGNDTDHGKYYENLKLVVFVCPDGHRNQVEMEL